MKLGLRSLLKTSKCSYSQQE